MIATKDLRFKIARHQANLTQFEVACRAQVPENLISRIESGRSKAPDRETAERIAKTLEKKAWEIGL